MKHVKALDRLGTEPALIDQVHDQLVIAISTGRLPAGARLTQESVADMLGISRQPVSHALHLLKYRGLVIEHGRRGLAVAPIDGERIRRLYQVREALDGLAARLAAERVAQALAPKAQIDAVQRALQEGEALPPNSEVIAFVHADVAFHRALYDLSGNPEIAQTIAEQWPQFMRSMAVVLDDDGHNRKIWREHRLIVAAVRAGNADTAEDLARAHAHRAGEDTARRIEAAAEKLDADREPGDAEPRRRRR